MSNLFSSFDPQASVFFLSLSYNWVSSLSVLLILPQLFWVTKNQLAGSLHVMISLLSLELTAVFGGFLVPGTLIIFLSVFFFILCANVMGLVPFVFTPSSHLVFTATLSLPLWMGTMVWSTLFQFNSMMAHLVPLGTPSPLMPVMVLIETVSSVIRPLTLAVRLAANMIAGHLLLALLGGQGSPGISAVMLMLTISLVLLLMLECAVACIQSYVFTILSSLYLNELLSVSFTKKNC